MGGFEDTMLLLKEKAEEMVREQVALQREREELRGNNGPLFGEHERRPQRFPWLPSAKNLRRGS